MKNQTALLLTALLMSSAPAIASAADWKVTEVNGQVRIINQQSTRTAVAGAAVRPGEVVSTARSSRAVLVRGGDYMMVAPESRVRIAEPQTDGPLVQVVQDLGSALFKVEKKSAPHFAVRTPFLAAVVKGTTFSVNVSNEGASVQVVEGAVEVATLDGLSSRLITPGIIGMAPAGAAQITTEAEPPAPPAPETATPAPGAPDQAPAEASVPQVFEPQATGPIALEGPARGARRGAAPSVPEVSEARAPLAQITGGLIMGDATLGNPGVAAAVHEKLAEAGIEPRTPNANSNGGGNGDGNGNAGGNGNGNGSGNGNGGGNGNWNGNSGGNGNGNSGGNGNGNGGGNGNEIGRAHV